MFLVGTCHVFIWIIAGLFRKVERIALARR
jgi:hypothetical protein